MPKREKNKESRGRGEQQDRVQEVFRRQKARKAREVNKDGAKKSLFVDSGRTLQTVGKIREEVMHRLAQLAAFPFIAKIQFSLP